MTISHENDFTYVSVDLEWDEQNQGPSTNILELGWTLWRRGDDKMVSKHWIVKEHEFIQNKFSPTFPHDFNFGPSALGSQTNGFEALKADLTGRRVVLLGHDLRHDIKIMQAHGIDSSSMKVDDTKNIFKELFPGQTKDGLGAVLNYLQIPNSSLHNAGNDARYTMEAFKALLQYQPNGFV